MTNVKHTSNTNWFSSSTSRHSISLDNPKRLLPFKWIFYFPLWFLLNFLNNNIPPKKPYLFKSKYIRYFTPEINTADWNYIKSLCASPSRTWCNLFWKKLKWDLIKTEVGELSIFDTGCGEGLYALMLNDFAKGIKSYCGIDFYKRDKWDELMKENSFIKLKQDSSSNIKNNIPQNTNLFMSQSAIEHFNFDLKYFNQLKCFINNSNKNIIQIHLFPSPACLWLYLYHGVRQYNLNSILKIINIFSTTKSYFRIYPLGGKSSNNLHFNFITKPHFFLRKDFKLNTNVYQEYLKKSILNDLKLKDFTDPSFYALIIHSNYKNQIF